MIRHHTIGRDADAGQGVGLGPNLLKGQVVSRSLKQGEPPNPTVEDMIGEVSNSEAWAAWYDGLFAENVVRLSLKRVPTLFCRAGSSSKCNGCLTSRCGLSRSSGYWGFLPVSYPIVAGPWAWLRFTVSRSSTFMCV